MTEITVQEYTRRNSAWVEALYSTKYEQCTGGLHKDGDGHCCLGVAADVSGLGFWTDSTDDADGDMLLNWVPIEHQDALRGLEAGDFPDHVPTSSDLMPEMVMEHYGIRTNNGAFDWFTLPVELRWKILQELMDHKKSIGEGHQEALLNVEADFSLKNSTHSLVFLNDAEVSFWLIAEVIKARPKGLFTWE
jgi:hypothetical protein